MDDTIEFNRERWEALSAAGVEFARPWLDLTEESARRRIDPEKQLESVAGRKVLCLAASGGQQSAAFGLLGAHVVVFDFSENQLAKDRATAEHYGVAIQTIQGDMRDLSRFADGQFDIVWFAHSLNFVPDASSVIAQIGRICGIGGRLRMTYTNPYVHGVWDNFRDGGYLIREPYLDGAEVHYEGSTWEFEGPDGQPRSVEGPKEFRHRLSTVINTLIASGFQIDGFWEDCGSEADAEPGSWKHFMSVAPPWLIIWARRG